MVNPMSILNKCMGRVPTMGRIVADSRSRNMGAYQDYTNIDNMEEDEERNTYIRSPTSNQKQQYDYNPENYPTTKKKVRVKRMVLVVNNDYDRNRFSGSHSAIRQTAREHPEHKNLKLNSIIEAKELTGARNYPLNHKWYDVLAEVSERKR